MTSFRDQVAGLDALRWPIGLATHAATPIANETSIQTLKLSTLRRKNEERYVIMWKRIRPPIAGYNCFGHVFASRRTGIYAGRRDGIVETILKEDGFSEVPDPKDYLVGDVVIYSDDRGVTHGARITRFDALDVGATEATTGSTFPVVLSKFDDVSGEYEHSLSDGRWHQWAVTWQVFRDRSAEPHYPTGWRAAIGRLGS